MCKRLLLFFFLVVSHVAWSHTILVDPGHGGSDTGATGFVKINGQSQKIYEKELTLQIANRIYENLKKKKHTVFLTRSFDREVSLDARAEMADKIKADIFVSVHLNATIDHSATGTEIYYLDNKRDAAVKKVEDAENDGKSGEELMVQHILVDLIVERTVETSQKLTASIQTKLLSSHIPKYKLKNRGVKAGLFYVLALAKRPGTLLEVGFMSNENELKLMMNADFQESYAKSIADGIDQYLKTLDKKAISFF